MASPGHGTQTAPSTPTSTTTRDVPHRGSRSRCASAPPRATPPCERGELETYRERSVHGGRVRNPGGSGDRTRAGSPTRELDRYDDPDQVALRAFVAHVRERIDPILEAGREPMAFRLDV